MDLCTDEVAVLVGAVKTIFTVIQIAIPGFLIVLGTIDMFKAMTSGDDKKTKEARTAFIKRLIYAVVAFLIPFIIRLVFRFIGNTVNTGDPTAMGAYEKFFACWNGNKVQVNGNGDVGTCVWPDGETSYNVTRDHCEGVTGANFYSTAPHE